MLVNSTLYVATAENNLIYFNNSLILYYVCTSNNWCITVQEIEYNKKPEIDHPILSTISNKGMNNSLSIIFQHLGSLRQNQNIVQILIRNRLLHHG